MRVVKRVAGGWAIFCIFSGLALAAGHVLPGGTLAFSSNRPQSYHNIFLLDVNRRWVWPLTSGKVTRSAIVWSRDGSAIFFISCVQTSGQLNCQDNTIQANGGSIEQADDQTYVNLKTGSPDGTRWVLTTDAAKPGIVVVNLNNHSQEQLTNNGDSANDFPAWSPDGNRIAFASNRDGNWEIYTMNSDGSNPRRLTFNDADDIEPAWAPDGAQIAFSSTRSGTSNIYVMNADGSNVRPLTADTWDNGSPVWRP